MKKEKHINRIKTDKLEFEKLKKQLRNLFDAEAVELELKCLNKHLTKIRNEQKIRKERKRQRDVTLACDDGKLPRAHNMEVTKFGDTSSEEENLDVTLACDDGKRITAHISSEVDNPDDTLALDDGKPSAAHKTKKKRRFKIRFLQPQPRKLRKKKTESR